MKGAAACRGLRLQPERLAAPGPSRFGQRVRRPKGTLVRPRGAKTLQGSAGEAAARPGPALGRAEGVEGLGSRRRGRRVWRCPYAPEREETPVYSTAGFRFPSNQAASFPPTTASDPLRRRLRDPACPAAWPQGLQVPQCTAYPFLAAPSPCSPKPPPWERRDPFPALLAPCAARPRGDPLCVGSRRGAERLGGRHAEG